MRGDILKAYCLLTEANEHIGCMRTPSNCRFIDELQSKIKQVKKGLYDLGGEE